MNRELSEETSLISLKISATLNSQLQKIMENSSKEDFEKMRLGIALVMGHLYTEVLEPIWKEHPDLLPEHMDGPYKVPEEIFYAISIP